MAIAQQDMAIAQQAASASHTQAVAYAQSSEVACDQLLRSRQHRHDVELFARPHARHFQVSADDGDECGLSGDAWKNAPSLHDHRTEHPWARPYGLQQQRHQYQLEGQP